MNIGMYTDTYYPQINGLVTSLNMLEAELVRRGHKVYIFTASCPGMKEDRPNVFRLPSISFKMSPQHRVAIVYPPKLLIKMLRFKLDIVHTHSEFPLGIFGRLVSEALRIPLIHTYHTLWEEYVHYFGSSKIITKKTARQYSRIFCNGADAVICPTEKTKNILSSYGVKKPMAIIPTGIDFAPFSEENNPAEAVIEARCELGLPDGAPVLVTICRVAREKSIDLIIGAMPEILKRIPGLKFVIVGDGPALSELKEQAAALGISDSVVFAGPRSWNEIGKYYRVGDLFISASTSETQGLTYIEAIAAGVIAVIRRDDSTQGIITDDETGFYFDGAEDLPGVLEKAMNKSAEEKAIIREKAYESVSFMSAVNFANSVEAFYKAAIDRANEKKKPKLKNNKWELGFKPPIFRKKDKRREQEENND